MYDSVHPNDQGYAPMGENWRQAIETFPLLKDSDGDGLSDADETAVYGTNPQNPDSDGDGYSDMIEVMCGNDPDNRVVRINFQPLRVVSPPGYAADGARAFSSALSFGWE